MTTETFHARMMNIPIPDHFNSAEDQAAGLRVTYKIGHRDARNDAAEIASEADAEIRRLVRMVDEERRTVAKMGHRLIEAHDELYILREQVRSLREQVDESNATIDDLRSGTALSDAAAEVRAAKEESARLAADLRRQEQCAEEVIRRLQSERRAALEEVDALTKSHDYVTSELRSAVVRLGLRHALADALKGQDPDRATAEQLARFLWIWSHDASDNSASDAAIRFVGSDRERFAKAIEEARGWLRLHDGGEWHGWSCAVLTGSQEMSSPGWYALPPGQWCGEPHILIERVERDGLELPTVAEAVDAWGVPAKGEE